MHLSDSGSEAAFQCRRKHFDSFRGEKATELMWTENILYVLKLSRLVDGAYNVNWSKKNDPTTLHLITIEV